MTFEKDVDLLLFDNVARKAGFASPMSSKIKQTKNNGWDGKEFEKKPPRYCALVVKKKQ